MKSVLDNAMRYLGAGGADAGIPSGQALLRQVEETLQAITAFPPRYTLHIFDVQPHALSDACGRSIPLPGELARTMLADCRQAAALVCTLGAEFDAHLLRLRHRCMAEAAVWDACGSAWVEHGCDEAETALRHRFPGKFFTARFSPGYGDFPLEIQPDFLAATDAQRRLGVTAGESFLMTPRKSVTAIIGISDVHLSPSEEKNCAACPLREDCIARMVKDCTKERNES